MSKEVNLKNALLSTLQALGEPPSDEDIEEAAKVLAKVSKYTGELEGVINEVKLLINTRMGIGVSLSNQESEHDPLWLEKREIKWTYHNAYNNFLKKEGWPEKVVNSLSRSTEKILSHLQDPLTEGRWSKRGLVIGNVQSGKTANYTGLITRAADAGYNFIIVIAGIHNNLRSQTQARIDESFIGRSSDPSNRADIGVALHSTNYEHPVTFTNVYDDFNRNTAASLGSKLGDYTRPIIFVIKKNIHTLRALYEWLKDMNAKKDGKITDVPMLMIDDEADNASINTNKEENNPTVTNAGIRLILSLFEKSAYVAYTATPFANIFINPDAEDEKLSGDLFPRDFIYCLEAPTNYFGASKIFQDEEVGLQHIRIIDDAEEYIPMSHKKGDEISELPPSLYEALNTFILSRAIRNLRYQSNKHCSMMVHVSRFVDYQRQVENLLNLQIKKIREAVLNCSKLPDEIALQNKYLCDLKKLFEIEFFDSEFSWCDVKPELSHVLENLKTRLINSESGDSLDFSEYDKEEKGLTIVAVGGLSLSRGLTIEGLTTSYLYRNTKMYDTLMQMGRWFGYRPNYEDVCRVYLSEDSYDWYAHIAEASENLIAQVNQMNRNKMSPKDFGLVVKSHPDSLLITAANKMLSGEEIVVQQSYSGLLRESHQVSLDPDINKKNLNLVKEFWSNNFGLSKEAKKIKKGFFYKNVDLNIIDEFLSRFEVHEKYEVDHQGTLSYLRDARKENVIPELGDVLLISPESGAGGEEPYTLREQLRKINITEYKSMDLWSLSKGRVAARGDEKYGLTHEELFKAHFSSVCSMPKEVLSNQEKEEFNKLAEESLEKNETLSDLHYRVARGRVLLMIHSLMPKLEGKTVELAEPIVAFGVSFPPQRGGKELVTTKVVANKVWLAKKLKIQDLDDIEGEDDE